jgi:pyruvate/2-oxoglutarate/acetoin dehydrogenase E1 component
MTTLSFGQALQRALVSAMDADESVFVAGEGVGVSIHANPNMPTHGLLERFGPRRVRDTPVSEAAIAGLAVGAACLGLRPVVEIMFFPFMTLASDMLVNHAGKLRYMSGGRSSFPLTVRVKAGVGAGAGSQHSHNLEAWLAHSPGLKLVWPSNPADANALLLAAIADPDPVIVVEDMGLYWMRGDVPADGTPAAIGQARVVQPGADCTVVAYGAALATALAGAEQAARDGISSEVIDLRSLVPLDEETLLASVRKTGRFVVVHEANRFCGYGAELAAMVAEKAFEHLLAPVQRVAPPAIPVPSSPPLAQFFKPSAADVASAIRKTQRPRARQRPER